MWASPDFSGSKIAVGLAGLFAPDRMPDRMREFTPDRMSEYMSDRMSERMPDRMPERMPDKNVRKDCQGMV